MALTGQPPQSFYGQPLTCELVRCRTCGAFVHVNDPVDKRTVFCSPLCSRRYWRHPERYERESGAEE